MTTTHEQRFNMSNGNLVPSHGYDFGDYLVLIFTVLICSTPLAVWFWFMRQRFIRFFTWCTMVRKAIRLFYKFARSWYYSTEHDEALLRVLEGGCNEELDEELVEVARPNLVEEGDEPMKAKRRIKSGERFAFQREIVAAVKAKFGTPRPTEANLRAVRRYATEVMRSHNLRFTHLQKVLPLIIAATFVPDKYEMEGMEVASCVLARDRQSEFFELKKAAGFTEA